MRQAKSKITTNATIFDQCQDGLPAHPAPAVPGSLSRRGFVMNSVVSAASVASAVALPAAALAEHADPIFAAIERHRAAVASFEDPMSPDEEEDQLWECRCIASWDLANTAPATLAGLGTLMIYANESGGFLDLLQDVEYVQVQDWTITCAACALAGLPKPGMSNIVAEVLERGAEVLVD